MSTTRPIAGWSPHAQQVAWFEAWLRAVRSNSPEAAALAQAELRRLGVEVRPITAQARQ